MYCFFHNFILTLYAIAYLFCKTILLFSIKHPLNFYFVFLSLLFIPLCIAIIFSSSCLYWNFHFHFLCSMKHPLLFFSHIMLMLYFIVVITSHLPFLLCANPFFVTSSVSASLPGWLSISPLLFFISVWLIVEEDWHDGHGRFPHLPYLHWLQYGNVETFISFVYSSIYLVHQGLFHNF